MNDARLFEALSLVTETATTEQYVPDALTQFMKSQQPKTDPANGQLLLEAVRSEEGLRLFSGGYQRLPGSVRPVSYRRLIEWMVRRALQVGARQVIADLERYVASDQIPVGAVAALMGILPEQELFLSPEIRMVPWPEAPSSLEKELLTSRPRRSVGILDPPPTCALVRSINVPKRHASEARPVQQPGPDYPMLMDACRLLTLVGPSSPVCIGFWYVPEPWVPHTLGLSITTPIVELGQPERNVFILRSDLFDRVRTLFTRYSHLDERERHHLRVPIDRLNQAQRRIDIADRIIDLGIAIEAIFLRDSSGTTELSYRVRVRAARFLRIEPMERDQVFNQFGNLYELRSRAVHDGQIKATSKNIEMIRQGTAIIAESLMKLIDKGPVDWRNVEMS
jgi:hypothetical protein